MTLKMFSCALTKLKRSLQFLCRRPGHLSPCKSCSVRIAKFVLRSWLDRLCSRVLRISDTITLICPHGEAFSGAVRCRRASSTLLTITTAFST